MIDAETYDALIDPLHVVPRLLVVVLVPHDMQHWLDHSSSEMGFRHCGYWACLKNAAPLPYGQDSKTIHLSESNRFDPHQLQAMMRHVADGRDLTTPLTVQGMVQ